MKRPVVVLNNGREEKEENKQRKKINKKIRFE